MHRLVLHNLGPVKDCDITVNDFMVFTGPQASGKSTIAKAIFFFRFIEDHVKSTVRDWTEQEAQGEFLDIFQKQLIITFIRLFHSFVVRSKDFSAYYSYNEGTFIRFSVLPSEKSNNNITLSLSTSLKEYIKELYARISTEKNWKWSDKEQVRLNQLLSEPRANCFFIPAGRSPVTLMANQMASIFDDMNVLQKYSFEVPESIFYRLPHPLS